MSLSESSLDEDDDDPELELRQNRHPAQVELVRPELLEVEDVDDVEELDEVEDDELDVIVPDVTLPPAPPPPAVEPRRLLRWTLRSARLTRERADLPERDDLPDATEPFLRFRLLRRFGAGVYSGCGVRCSWCMPCSGWGSSSSRGANTGEGDLSRWIELVSCARPWTSGRAAAAEGVSGFWRIGRSGTGAANSGEAVPVRDRSNRARGEVGDSVREGERALPPPPFDERMLCRRRRAGAAFVRVVAGTTRAGSGSCKSGRGKSIKFGLSLGGGVEEELNSSASSRLAVPTSPRALSLNRPVRTA